MTHLWEIDHPYYAPDGYANECESFEELKHNVGQCDEDMNFIYRWDWFDPQAPCNDSLFLPDEWRGGRNKLTVHMIQPRKSRFINFWCPVTHDQEDEVLVWLCGPRVAGHLRKWWEPVLDLPEVTS
jgi:hypothetical protein